jgi:ABC-type uncharacterized transport system permease subunit/basic membrane lipoprotein Med (substrate-binding protein (PBP1-ABC) superfamily)
VQTPPSRHRIGLVTDVGRLGRGTFSQCAVEGMTRAAQERGVACEVLETTSPADYEDNIEQLIERGCGVVVTIGSATGMIVERLAQKHPAVHFIVVDYEPTPESRNITGLVFAEDQAGFLAGALAGLMTQRDVVGFIGGMDIPPVRRFQRGFEHGLSHTNRLAKIIEIYTDSFNDTQAGETAAQNLIQQGTDIIFAAAGLCGSAAIRAAAREGTWVIGVDQDEWETTFQDGQVPGAERLLTSAVKQVDNAVYTAVSQALQGRLRAGVHRFDLASNGVGLAPYHAADTAIPSETRGKITEVTEALRSGRIRTLVGLRGEERAGGLLSRLTAWNWQAALVPVLAIITALVIGALFIAAFDPQVWAAFGQGVRVGLGTAWQAIVRAYTALFQGAFGNPSRIVEGLRTYLDTGESRTLLRAIYPLTESLRIATPYIFAGLAVAIGFRANLFNIGAEGQYFIGGLTSVYVGYALTGLPWFIHLPLALLAGMVGGALWASIAGFLKARAGAHEVITTMMLNYVSYRLADYLLQVGGPMSRPGDYRPVSPEIQPSAYLPQFFPSDPSMRVNVGLLLALVAVVVIYWLLFKTTLGFEIRAVGLNARAARTAGISVPRTILITMAISGALAGLAGAHDILGVLHFMPNAFFSGYGFDSIALALLGRSHPAGVLLAALLFGFLRAGAQRMQGVAQVPIDIISVLQALIIIFIAAPELVRMLYRIRVSRSAEGAMLARGWGGT